MTHLGLIGLTCEIITFACLHFKQAAAPSRKPIAKKRAVRAAAQEEVKTASLVLNEYHGVC